MIDAEEELPAADSLTPVRGIALAVIMAIPIWTVIGWAVSMAFG